jgi:hypothetical protein
MGEILLTLRLLLDCWLENLISVYLKGHLSIVRLGGVKVEI